MIVGTLVVCGALQISGHDDTILLHKLGSRFFMLADSHITRLTIPYIDSSMAYYHCIVPQEGDTVELEGKIGDPASLSKRLRPSLTATVAFACLDLIYAKIGCPQPMAKVSRLRQIIIESTGCFSCLVGIQSHSRGVTRASMKHLAVHWDRTTRT